MRYYLDTNIIIYALKNTFPSIKSHFEKIPAQSILIPDIVMAEIEYGAKKTVDYNKTIQHYNQFTDIFLKEPFDYKCAKAYGIIRSTLEKQGTPIGANDMLIAATVLANKGILVTHNTKEFSRINGLLIEDWTL